MKTFRYNFLTPSGKTYSVEGRSYEEVSKSVHWSDRMLTITRI